MARIVMLDFLFKIRSMISVKKIYLIVFSFSFVAMPIFSQLMPDNAADKDALTSWELWLTVFVAVVVLGIIQYVKKSKNRD